MMNFGGLAHLDDDELQALRDSRFWIDCLAMRLQGGAGDPREVYSGPGYIRQKPDGCLTFTLYAEQRRSRQKAFEAIGTRVLGATISDDEFFVLTATDTLGRTWVSEHLLPNLMANFAVEGVVGSVCSGPLHEMKLTVELSGTHEGSYLFMQTFGKFKIPVNTYTETIESTGPRRRRERRANAIHFEAAGYEVLLMRESDLLQLEMSSKESPLPQNFELRVVEALEFLLARDCTWSVMQRRSGNDIVVSIQTDPEEEGQAHLVPPIIWNAGGADEAFERMFRAYLGHIADLTESRWHPIAARVRAIRRGSTGTVEAQALTMGVQIEGLLGDQYPDCARTNSEAKDQFVSAIEHMRRWEGPDVVSRRILNVINGMWGPRAADRLQVLVDSGVITGVHKKAWSDVRNASAHASSMADAEIDELIVNLKVLVDLVYRLVLNRIGYEGDYTDYSTKDWPIRSFEPVSDPCYQNVGGDCR